jgi:membrane associated rhomboid family serine protease
MRYDTRFRTTGFASSYFPTGVKWLLIANIAMYLLYFFGVRFGFGGVFNLLALSPRAVLEYFAIWQPVTYMFLHDPYGFGHILFNMLALWMFGADLERDWGTRRFLKYYFVCGVGAAMCDIVFNALFGSLNVRTIGASGAIYGLLLAFGMLYPDRTVLFSFLFPIKAKYFVMIIGAIAFLSSFSANSGVSHIAHLGGMFWGYLFLKFRMRGVRLQMPDVGRRYQQWKLQRAKRKFQVYLKKHQSGSDRDRWVN